MLEIWQGDVCSHFIKETFCFLFSLLKFLPDDLIKGFFSFFKKKQHGNFDLEEHNIYHEKCYKAVLHHQSHSERAKQSALNSTVVMSRYLLE